VSISEGPAEAGHHVRHGAQTRYRLLAWIVAGLMAAAISFSVLRIPIQVTDSLLVMLQVQAAPSASLSHFVGEEGFLRPIYMAQTRVLLDAAAGAHYYLVFRGFHVALVAALFALFVIAARVRTRTDFAALAFALVVLTGHHTFRGNVWESYPVNHYLEIAVYCLGALVLSQSRGGWWADVLAPAIFLLASLTLESGLIVWVVFFVARCSGLKGVSWVGVGLVTLALGGYLYVRFAYYGSGMPSLDERSVGFWFGRVERNEINARFGDAPYLLYAYNVVSSLLSILLSEPRNGTWEMTRRWLAGEAVPSVVVSVLSAAVATGLVSWFIATRLRRWVARRFDHDDQLVLIFLGVTAANAAICYAYTKDEVMSTAGAFYALAVFAAVRTAIGRFASLPRQAVATAAMTLLLLIGSATWSVRSIGLHYHMYYSAYYQRNEWPRVDEWLAQQRVAVRSAEGRQLVAALRSAATSCRCSTRTSCRDGPNGGSHDIGQIDRRRNSRRPAGAAVGRRGSAAAPRDLLRVPRLRGAGRSDAFRSGTPARRGRGRAPDNAWRGAGRSISSTPRHAE
jgi:hypothetical protein